MIVDRLTEAPWVPEYLRGSMVLLTLVPERPTIREVEDTRREEESHEQVL
jgi:hypothetical protein